MKRLKVGGGSLGEELGGPKERFLRAEERSGARP
jgi:hypothetical protein